MNREDKLREIEALNQEFKKAQNLFLASFQGMTVSQDTELRRSLRATGSHYKVVKNTLARKAAKDTPIESIQDHFSGTTAMAYNARDPVTLAKVLSTFAKNNPLFVFKAGVVQGRVVKLKDLEQIANLPSKEELISKFMFLLNCQAQRLANVLSGVSRNLAIVLNQAGEKKKFAE